MKNINIELDFLNNYKDIMTLKEVQKALRIGKSSAYKLLQTRSNFSF